MAMMAGLLLFSCVKEETSGDNNTGGGTINTGNYFSVSPNEHVVFSPGNLQWSATGGGTTPTTHAVAGGGTAAGTWRFAPNQWDTIGANNTYSSATYTGWIDLFGWGTSGYHDDEDQYNIHYLPYSTSFEDYYNSFNRTGYGPSTIMHDRNLTGSSAKYDWGVYNAIYNPHTQSIDPPGTWRTLTREEWRHLLKRRTDDDRLYCAGAYVNGVRGVIIVPDNWNNSTYPLRFKYYNTGRDIVNFNDNDITVSQWTTLENAGCIFLPAAGSRIGSDYTDSVGYGGYYWTSSNSGDKDAYGLEFDNAGWNDNVQATLILVGDMCGKTCGFSVRLVRDVQ